MSLVVLTVVLSISVLFPKMREGSQFQFKIKMKIYSNLSFLNLPLTSIHILTVTAVIKSVAKPTETTMGLKETEKSVKRIKKKILVTVSCLVQMS